MSWLFVEAGESHLIPGMAATTKNYSPCYRYTKVNLGKYSKEEGLQRRGRNWEYRCSNMATRGGIAHVNNSGGKFKNNVQWLLYNYINFPFNITNREWSSFFNAHASWKFQLKLKGEIDFALGSIRYFLCLVRAEGKKLGSYRILLTKGGLEPASSYSWVLGLDLWLHCDSRNVSHVRKSPASTWQITPDTVSQLRSLSFYLVYFLKNMIVKKN